MAFWKKSEDPWDVDPAKKKQQFGSAFGAEEPKEGEKGFLESIREEVADWQEKKKAAAEAEANMPPPVCPWCGRSMTRVYLLGGRDRLRLSDQKPTAFLGSLGHNTIEFNEEGFMATYKACWQCKPCRKLVADVPEQQGGEVQERAFEQWDGTPRL